MGTVRALAQGDPLKAESIFLLPYSLVFKWMQMNHDEGIFQKNYAEVLRRKVKTK